MLKKRNDHDAERRQRVVTRGGPGGTGPPFSSSRGRRYGSLRQFLIQNHFFAK